MVIELKEEEHFEIGGSAIKRIAHCAGARNAIKKAIEIGGKPKTNFAAAEGTVAHKVLEERLTRIQKPETWIVQGLKGVEFRCSGHMVTVDDEMIEAVEVAVDFVKQEMASYGITAESMQIETVVHVPPHPQTAGAADWIGWSFEHGVLSVVDYKHGKGVKVTEEDIIQLLFYGVGALFQLTEEQRNLIQVVRTTLIQPRHFSAGESRGVTTWAHTKDHLLSVVHPQIVEAAERSEGPNAPIVAGSWCKWCPAQMYVSKTGEVFECAAQKEQRNEITGMDFASVAKTLPAQVKAGKAALPKPESLSIEQMAAVITKRALFDSWLDSIEQKALEMAIQGTVFPGCKIVESIGNREYANPDVAETFLQFQLGDAAYKKTLLTPTQAEKAGVKNINQYVVRKNKGKELVPLSDKRPPVSVGADFESVKKEQ